MPPRNARGRAKSLTGARGARGPRGARRNLDEGDDHQESMMGGRASAPVENVGNVGGAPPTILGGAEFMQGVFTAIEQVVRNTVQTMQVPVRTAESRATTAVKAFLQLRPPTFKGEPDPLVAEDWLEQVTRALDTILVTEEDLRVLFASYQLQGDALQWWKTMEEVEKAKQFMRGLRPSIRNKIARNLIKVYSTMVSAAAAIEETLNETRKIQNPKSQREGTSNQSEGRSFKKPRTYTAQQQYTTRSLPATSVISSGQTSRGGPIRFGCHQPGHCIVDCPLKGQQRQSQQGGQSHIQAQGQSLVKGPPTCYRCGQVGHISRQCTKRENSQGATGSQQPTRSVQASRATPAFTSAQPSYQSRPQAVTQQGQRMQGRVYAMTSAAEPSGTTGQQEQQLDTSVVRGTLLMFNTRARVLIDMGASHTFIASSFALALGLKVEILDSVLMLDTPMGGP
ncbi:hypothetical protein Acr_19g0011180 [Actinidia rufa]|uniref:CCHC-type domain-containing protein n=1 Tax=Actinidia rufa TaxID=165716 RepID=A0A7J0GBP1_9ERIC|nr:hypothetical protein Acr_19g0011180 [Actinidia rufa]